MLTFLQAFLKHSITTVQKLFSSFMLSTFFFYANQLINVKWFRILRKRLFFSIKKYFNDLDLYIVLLDCVLNYTSLKKRVENGCIVCEWLRLFYKIGFWPRSSHRVFFLVYVENSLLPFGSGHWIKYPVVSDFTYFFQFNVTFDTFAFKIILIDNFVLEKNVIVLFTKNNLNTI